MGYGGTLLGGLLSGRTHPLPLISRVPPADRTALLTADPALDGAYLGGDGGGGADAQRRGRARQTADFQPRWRGARRGGDGGGLRARFVGRPAAFASAGAVSALAFEEACGIGQIGATARLAGVVRAAFGAAARFRQQPARPAMGPHASTAGAIDRKGAERLLDAAGATDACRRGGGHGTLLVTSAGACSAGCGAQQPTSAKATTTSSRGTKSVVMR